MFNFVILSGGSGTRLWPKSREKLPKQLLKLVDQHTMLQNTILRVLKFKNDDDVKITIICNKQHGYTIDEQVKELNISQSIKDNLSIITEPMGRDSAPAICIASLLGKEEDNTFILPCDHIFNDEEFVRCCNESLQYLDNHIITFGIKPTKIETGYGYIKIRDGNIAERFVEKPNYETAKTYFESGSYLWNAGLFIFKNSCMINLYSDFAPDILAVCRSTILSTDLNNRIANLPINPFANCRSISVDYAIMEKACIAYTKKTVVTLLYNSYWNDIGSFEALYEVHNKNDDQNVFKGEIVNYESKNCYVDSHKLVAIIGLDNIVVIDTPDALLVCNKDMSQNVKKIIEQLKKDNKKEKLE